MKIYAFSIDLKLDAEGHGYKILEVNDGLRSGFEGYKAATGQAMFADVMLEDYKSMFPDHCVVSALDSGELEEGRKILYAPRSNSAVHYYTRSELATNARLQMDSINADLRFLHFCSSKACQNEIFSSDPELEKIHPATRLITTSLTDAHRDYDEWIYDLEEKVVLKPDEEHGGNGVMIFDGPYAKMDLIDTLKATYSRKGPVWCGVGGFVALIQDLLPPNIVLIDERPYDATMRVVATVWQDSDDAPFQCKIHGAYWKPSAAPYEGQEDRLSRISYSASYEEQGRKEPFLRKFGKTLRQSFTAALTGRVSSGLTYAPKPVEGIAITEETREALFPQLMHSLPRLIERAVAKPVGEKVLEWLASDKKEIRALGVSTALNCHYYPESRSENGRDIIGMSYPQEIVEGLQAYIHRHYNRDPFTIGRLQGRLSYPGTVACDQDHNVLKQPLFNAILEAERGAYTGLMFSVLSRSLKI